jgi:hypothetical protein
MLGDLVESAIVVFLWVLTLCGIMGLLTICVGLFCLMRWMLG